MSRLKVSVPTTTILGCHPDDRFQIVVLQSKEKHDRRLVLPGGRVNVGEESFFGAAHRELKEETNMTSSHLDFFCTSSKPGRDTRIITAEKFADGGFVPKVMRGMELEAHYGFDIAVWGLVEGEKSDGIESSSVFFYNLKELDEGDFALDHGHLAWRFHQFLESKIKPSLSAL